VLLVALASGALQVSMHLSSLDPRRLQLADSVSNRILALSAQHDSIGIVYARDVEDTLEYARDMRDVLVRSTAFDADLQEVRAAVQHLRRTAAPPWTAERRVFGALDSLLGVFLAQSRLRQAAAHAVLEGGFVEDRPRFIREVRYLDSDANYLSGEVQRILQTIGAGDGT
jgi:hypothetical protein